MHRFYLRCIFFMFTVKTYCVITEREVNSMSPKELLYIEDTLDHLTESKKCCANFASEMKDPALRSLLQNITAKETQLFNQFYSLLNA